MGFVVLRTDDVTTEDACCLPFFEDHFSLHGDAFRTDWKVSDVGDDAREPGGRSRCC